MTSRPLVWAPTWLLSVLRHQPFSLQWSIRAVVEEAHRRQDSEDDDDDWTGSIPVPA